MITWPKLEGAWCAATSSDHVRWTEKNPSLGQCAPTALIVQDYFGGVLLRTENCGVSHYWNKLDSGIEIDLTRDQFDVWAPRRVVERDRDYVLSYPDTARRYQLLVSRLVEPS